MEAEGSDETPISTSEEDDIQTPTPDTNTATTIQQGLTNFSGIEAPTPKPGHPVTEEEEEDQEGEDEEIEETRSSPVKHRGKRDVSACGRAWAWFGPRLKTDKDIGGAGSAREVPGDGVVCRVRWGVIPQAADTLVAAVALASASVASPLPEKSSASPGGSGCMISLHFPFLPRSPVAV